MLLDKGVGMEVVFRDAFSSDAVKINTLLKKSSAINTDTLLRDIIGHIGKDNSIAKVIDSSIGILGVWMSKEFDTHTSLSFFYIHEDVRRRIELYIFFRECMTLVNKDKPLVISTKDITGFERYVEKIGDELYQFKGLR